MQNRKTDAGTSIKGRVVINPDIKFTDDDICCLLLGLNMEQLVRDIQLNKGGKYDELYVKETSPCP